MKYVKGGKKRRGTNWGTCVSAGENCGMEEQTDGQMGRKEEWNVERGRQTEELGRGRQRNGLAERQREKGCEGKKGRFVRCVMWNYSNRQVGSYRD